MSPGSLQGRASCACRRAGSCAGGVSAARWKTELLPAFGVYLLGQRPPAFPWESRWLRWPDFGLPADRAAVLPTLTEAWQRSGIERVEVACAGGHGRTGTALACLAILDGVPSSEAVAFVRENYDPHAVETFWQCRYVARFPGRR